MKVKELIEKLKQFDENLPVVVDTRDCEVRDFYLEDKGIYTNGICLIITYRDEEDEG